MTHFKYSLEKRSKKHPCPACGKLKTFVRYIEKDTQQYLPAEYGRCDRAENCGYHLNPYRDGYAKAQKEIEPTFEAPVKSAGKTANFNISTTYSRSQQTKVPEPVLIPNEILEATIRNGFDGNTFIQNLSHRVPFPFDASEVERVADLYKLGTVVRGGRAGSLTIPYIDQLGGVRFIQVKSFDHNNHTTGTDSLPSIIGKHYLKNNTPIPAWLEAYQKNDLKVSCLFGAHLLPNYPSNRIALVEAPKTAICGTLYFGLPEGPDDLLWMAVYSRDTLTVEKCKAIQGRTVYLFPDLSKDGSTFKLWQSKADEIMKALPGTRFVVSKLLEEMANSKDREKGADMADYLIQYDWREFRNNKPQKIQAQIPEVISQAVQNKEPSTKKAYTVRQNFTPGSWDKEIEMMDKFFETVEEMDGPIKLNGVLPVDNIKGFLKANLEPARAQSGNSTYLPYLDRLWQLHKYLKDQ